MLFVTRVKEHDLRSVFELSSGFDNYQSFHNFMSRVSVNYQVVKFDLAPGYNRKDYSVFKELIWHTNSEKPGQSRPERSIIAQ